VTPEARRQIQGTIDQLQALLDADCDCPEADQTTVAELWERYLATLPAEKWVASVVSTMKALMARIGSVQASKLRSAHVEDYRDDPEIRARYCVTSRRIQIKRLRTMLTWAVDTGRLAANPIARMKLEKAKPKRETEISAEGEAAALERMDATMRAFFLVAIDTGMRRGEIRLLEWTDIDRDGRTIQIPAARTKTRKARTVRLTSRAVDALLALPPIPGAPWVFVNPETKQPYCETTIWNRWRAAVDGAELEPAEGDESVRLHDSRGTMISRMVRLGASIPAIQVMVGHASLQTTAGYIRVQGRDVDEAAALLEAHLLLAKHQRRGPHGASGAAKVDHESESATG
jgi:integrase